jgi:hypothetical protein
MADTVEHMLTTVDNPWNPFTNFDEWRAFDEAQGYHTSAFLARVVRTSEALSEDQQDSAIEQAIDEIVSENVLGLYRKVSNVDTEQVTSEES